METLTRLVSESLARHGFDRPLDYRRLRWSRWFRCESHHSLLSVPSKPGVFALAEEIPHVADPAHVAEITHVETAAPQTLSEATENGLNSEADSRRPQAPRRMLAVAEFFEDDDMAFVLDRMLSQHHPMRIRLSSGRYFVRFVVIEEQSQRRSICAALNQWIASSAEKVTGIGAHFASSLELTEHNLGRPSSPAGGAATLQVTNGVATAATAPQLDSGAETNIHSPSPFPSGF